MKSPAKFFCSMSIIALLLECIFSVYIFSSSVTKAADASSFVEVKENATTLKRYDKFELTLKLNAAYDNPFRADTTTQSYRDADATSTGYGVLLDAYVVTPSGAQVNVPGYFDVDYAQTLTSTKDYFAVNSGSHWHIRYTPKQEGKYQYYVTLKDKNGIGRYPASGTKEFTATSEINPAFPHGGLVKSTTNPGYLEYEDGTPYTQFGADGITTLEADTQLTLMQQNGANFLREWLTNGSESSIFRNTSDNRWKPNYGATDNPKREYSTDTAYNGGKQTFRVTASSIASAQYLLKQPSIPVLPSTCYTASVWTKNTNFSGSYALSVKGSKTYSGSTISSGQSGWVKMTVNPFKTSTEKVVEFNVSSTNTMSGVVYLDDTSIYQTEQNADGTCSSNLKYGTSAVNLIWDPSFELAEDWSSGNPNQLNMENLARFEYLLDKAATKNIVVQPCIFDYKVWGHYTGDHSNWAPFLGYDASPAYSFFTDEFSRNIAKYDLRYLIARFGYSPALGVWELNNEMDKAYDISRYNWLSEMSNYIHVNDPYKHLVTASYWGSPGASQNEHIPTIDVNEVHFYINENTRNHHHLDPLGIMWDQKKDASGVAIHIGCNNATIHTDEYGWAIRSLAWANNNSSNQDYDGDIANHAILSGEFGLMGDEEHWTGDPRTSYCKTGDNSHWATPNDTSAYKTVRVDSTGIFFHNAVWSMLMATGYKASVSNWFGVPYKAWNYGSSYKAPSIISAYIPFRDASTELLMTKQDIASFAPSEIGNPVEVQSLTTSNTDHPNIRVMGRKKDNYAYLWVQNRNNTYQNRILDGNAINAESGKIVISNFTANTTVPFKIFDSYTGEIIKTSSVTVDGAGKATIDVALSVEKPDLAIVIGNTYKDPIAITQSASISDGGTVAHGGDKINYTVAVKNSSNVIQTTTLTDPLDTTYVNFESANNNGIFATVNGQPTITWKDLPVNPNSTVTISFTVVVKTVTPPPPPPTALISGISTTSQKTYPATVFSSGKSIYIDKSFTIKTIPATLAGADGIKTAYADRTLTNSSFLSFTLSQKSDVYVAYDSRIRTLPGWLSSWKNTGLTITDNERTPVTYKVYTNTYAAGKVTLGGNTGGTKGNMYFVLAKPVGLVSDIKASSGKAYVTAQMQTGSVVYSDRTYTINAIDAGIPSDSTWIQTANGDKAYTDASFLTFSLNADSNVYVAVDSRSTAPAWLQDWTPTGMVVKTNDLNGVLPFNVYSKKYTAGTVTLGGNGSTSGCMYLVIVDKI